MQVKHIKAALKMAWLAGWLSHSPHEVDEIVEGLFKDLVERTIEQPDETTTKEDGTNE